MTFAATANWVPTGCAQTSAPPPAHGVPPPELLEEDVDVEDDDVLEAEVLPPPLPLLDALEEELPPLPLLDALDEAPPAVLLDALDEELPPLPLLDALDDEAPPAVLLDALDEDAPPALDVAAPDPEPPCPVGPFEVPQAARRRATPTAIVAICFITLDLAPGATARPMAPITPVGGNASEPFVEPA